MITAEQIRDNGYFTLEDALADLPGFQFRNILGFNSYLFMRGVPSQNNKILLLVDGVQINELNSGGFYAGGQFNLTNVDRIEVVYGPGVRALRHQRRFRHHQRHHPGSQGRQGRPSSASGRKLPHPPGRFPLRRVR